MSSPHDIDKPSARQHPGRPNLPPRGNGGNGRRNANGGRGANGANGANGAGSTEHGRGIRDQIRRYRGSFIAVIGMVAIAVVVGGYVLANERLNVPGGFPILGKNRFTLSAYFSSAQALTPGQGQEITIAGAKIGEIENVELKDGRALVKMGLAPQFARIYHNATLLVRPKTPLQEMTVEIDPGTPSAGRLASGAVIPVSQTSPNINFDQFLSALDTETRYYLQQLLAGAAEGLNGNGRNLAAAYKRFDPLARNVEEITKELSHYHANIARGIHSFSSLLQALAEVEKELSELVVSSNRVFRVFAAQQHNVERTLQLLPGALSKTQAGLGKLAAGARELGPTLAALHPFATELAPASKASQQFTRATTPIIANQIRPFTREAAPALAKLGPASADFANALPGLTVGFSVLNELFNELAFNPGSRQGGFLFFADWAAHNVNSVYSSTDAHGAQGNATFYLKEDLLCPIKAAARQDPAVTVLIGLLNLPQGKPLPSGKFCAFEETAGSSSAKTASSASVAGTARAAKVAAPLTSAVGGIGAWHTGGGR
jgi:phospholipid/cholesterol/gamma-HCH transport system substrate-binding protein